MVETAIVATASPALDAVVRSELREQPRPLAEELVPTAPARLALVLALLFVNPIFYSFYANIANQPRFLYASLPALSVLWAAGVGAIVSFSRWKASAETRTA
jgi:hypothetical protein